MLIVPTPNPALLLLARQQFDFAYIPGSAASNTVDQTTYTFSSVPLGNPDGTRTIVVAVMGRAAANRYISSVTVAGVAATEIAQSSNTYPAGGEDTIAGIYRADVPAGTSGAIVVTFSGGMVRAGIAAYRMVHAAPGVYYAAIVDYGSSGTIAVPAGGAAIAVASNAILATATWTGLTEDVHMDVESKSSFRTASDKFESAQPSLSVSVSWSGPSRTLCIASFAPA